MAKWLLSSILDRFLVALALYLAYLGWEEPLHKPMQRLLTISSEIAAPYAKLLRALD